MSILFEESRAALYSAADSLAVHGFHGEDHEMRWLITLYNSTKLCIYLRLKTITPHKSTQLYIGCASIGLNGISTDLRGLWGIFFTLCQADGRFPLFYGAARSFCLLRLLCDICINVQRGGNIRVSQGILDDLDIDTGFTLLRGEGMPQRMTAEMGEKYGIFLTFFRYFQISVEIRRFPKLGGTKRGTYICSSQRCYS